MSFRHVGMDGILVDERLQIVAGILVVQLGGAHSHVEVGVGPQILLLVLRVFIDILKILLGGSVLLFVEQIHGRLEFVLRRFVVFCPLRMTRWQAA